jgi:hypothetical protein
MSTVLRGTHYRHPMFEAADWIVVRRHADGTVNIYSNKLGTNVTVPETDLVVADRSEHPSLLLGLDDPDARQTLGSSAVGASSPTASSGTSSPGFVSARPDSSPGKGGQPLARTSDPQTAHDAAHAARSTAAHNRYRVLQAHYAAGERGLTGDELAAATGLPYAVIGPRRPSLEADGLIAATNVRRPSNRGTLQQVYAITEVGRVTAERSVA